MHLVEKSDRPASEASHGINIHASVSWTGVGYDFLVKQSDTVSRAKQFPSVWRIYFALSYEIRSRATQFRFWMRSSFRDTIAFYRHFVPPPPPSLLSELKQASPAASLSRQWVGRLMLQLGQFTKSRNNVLVCLYTACVLRVNISLLASSVLGQAWSADLRASSRIRDISLAVWGTHPVVKIK